MRHAVVPGDNLWTIAAASLAGRLGVPVARLSDAQIGPYWALVVAANRPFLGNPNLIYPGQSISLPN